MPGSLLLLFRLGYLERLVEKRNRVLGDLFFEVEMLDQKLVVHRLNLPELLAEGITLLHDLEEGSDSLEDMVGDSLLVQVLLELLELLRVENREGGQGDLGLLRRGFAVQSLNQLVFVLLFLLEIERVPLELFDLALKRFEILDELLLVFLVLRELLVLCFDH